MRGLSRDHRRLAFALGIVATACTGQTVASNALVDGGASAVDATFADASSGADGPGASSSSGSSGSSDAGSGDAVAASSSSGSGSSSGGFPFPGPSCTGPAFSTACWECLNAPNAGCGVAFCIPNWQCNPYFLCYCPCGANDVGCQSACQESVGCQSCFANFAGCTSCEGVCGGAWGTDAAPPPGDGSVLPYGAACTTGAGVAALCEQVILSNGDAGDFLGACETDGGATTPSCSSVGLTGCCRASATDEICHYDPSLAAAQQAQCTQDGGIWSPTP